MRLRYRDPTDRSGFASWVRALRGKNGAYVIRSRSSRQVLYVGESHSGRLYETLTRHFQAWRLPGERGKTYDRHRVEVAVSLTHAGDAYAEQNRLIRKLRPADNVLEGPDSGGLSEETRARWIEEDAF